ncbi:MAG: hypothetical protein HDR50_05310 [Desulfovibrio sp.]|uniref:BPL-N domain-containing protein n=1 Tax=Desulfovibrio sp. TaxID=885 RepID=UPI001A7C139E|nr:BPL-N domain-containing protein [Desulfovibrio sp.]MBD5417071.1 hypothetical protein [Desulfovibrio sp.]
MQRESSVHILWDASHIWGLMAWRALRALGVPSRLVKAKEIAEGALSGKPGRHGRARLLLVPGGSAGRKAALLGSAGREAVRDFVRKGGTYLGFCGGAGLALSPAPEGRRDEAPLGLCPWTRAPYVQRFQHLISGHLLARATDAGADASRTAGVVSLPVWWPGRFAPESGSPDVTVLATSVGPDADLWLADLPLAGISPRVLETWRNCYGVDLSPDFLAGQPLAVCGSFGAGRYLLSYSHLETPESPAANAWLARILRGFGIAVAGDRAVPAWQLDSETPLPPARKDGPAASARRACARIRALLELGVTQRLFFRRTSWLRGWRAGLPGMACNNLMAAFAELAEVAVATAEDRRRDAARAALDDLWARLGPRFDRLLDLFADGAESWFMASRLSDLLSPTLPHAVDARGLAHQRAALFGHPMRGGGIAEELLQMAEEGIYTAQALAAPQAN